MASTKNEVRDLVAGDLGILPLGQSLEAQDSARILKAIDHIYADLKVEGLATWASTGSVPDEVTPYYTTLIAESLLLTYSVSPERANKLIAGASGAKRNIRALVKPEYLSGDNTKDY